MPNPADILKIMSMKNRFEANHPKFVAFIKSVAKTGLPEGTVVEVKVTSPEGVSTTANMRVTADDVSMINEIKTLK